MASLNPSAPNEIVGEVAEAGIPEAERAVKAALSGVRPLVPHLGRASRAVARSALRRSWSGAVSSLPPWKFTKSAKPWEEADGDIREAMDFCLFYAQQMRILGRPQTHAACRSAKRSYQHYWPRGVALVIAPWNFPIAILTGMVSAAIVDRQHACIMKPAEPSVRSTGALVDGDVRGSRCAAGRAQSTSPGHGSVIGQHLVRSPGSRDDRVHRLARSRPPHLGISRQNPLPGQRELKRVVCEMGGKNAHHRRFRRRPRRDDRRFDLLRLRLSGSEMFRALAAHRARRKLRPGDGTPYWPRRRVCASAIPRNPVSPSVR